MGKHKRKSKDDELFRIFKKFAKKMRKRSGSTSDTDNAEQPEENVPGTSNDILSDELPEATIEPAQSDEPIPEVPDEPAQDSSILDEETLKLLGEDPNKNAKYEKAIHKDICSRWQHITISGMEKDSKTELFKSYKIPENCKFLEAPLLNPEIKAAISDAVQKKDKAVQLKQERLGQLGACIGKALDICIKDKDQMEVTKLMSDAGRMLCEIFNSESQSRRSSLQFALNKNTKDIVTQAPIGKYIFGDNLGEALKAGKAINKTGTEIKYDRPKPTSKTTQKTATLNSRGPPRKYQSSQFQPSVGKPAYRTKPGAAQPRRAPPAPRIAPSHKKT